MATGASFGPMPAHKETSDGVRARPVREAGHMALGMGFSLFVALQRLPAARR